MKKIVYGALAITIAAAGSAVAAERKNIAWSGSSPGAVMYYMVGAAGTVISRDLPEYNITQVTSAGSTENAKRLIKGEIDMGIVYGSHIYLSQEPAGPFKNGPKGTMFRGISKAYEGPTYFVTLKGNGIKSMSDLKGKTVALGPPGSGTVFNCMNILKATGLVDTFKVRLLTFSDAGRALGNGQIDALCQSSSPAAAVTELAETRDVVIVPYAKDEMANIEKTYPFYYANPMPKGTYKGVPAIQLPYTTVYWVAHERVSEKAVYDILKHMYKPEIRKELAAGHRNWKQMAPSNKNFLKLGAPMHPGAEKYYKEAGIWE